MVEKTPISSTADWICSTEVHKKVTEWLPELLYDDTYDHIDPILVNQSLDDHFSDDFPAKLQEIVRTWFYYALSYISGSTSTITVKSEQWDALKTSRACFDTFKEIVNQDELRLDLIRNHADNRFANHDLIEFIDSALHNIYHTSCNKNDATWDDLRALFLNHLCQDSFKKAILEMVLLCYQRGEDPAFAVHEIIGEHLSRVAYSLKMKLLSHAEFYENCSARSGVIYNQPIPHWDNSVISGLGDDGIRLFEIDELDQSPGIWIGIQKIGMPLNDESKGSTYIDFELSAPNKAIVVAFDSHLVIGDGFETTESGWHMLHKSISDAADAIIYMLERIEGVDLGNALSSNIAKDFIKKMFEVALTRDSISSTYKRKDKKWHSARIAHAARLCILASKTHNTALRFSIGTTALECMTKAAESNDIATTLTNRCIALLETDRDYFLKARDCVKNLYKQRCVFTHATGVTDQTLIDTYSCDQLFTLICSVMLAFINRYDFHHKVGMTNEEVESVMFKELDDLIFDAKKLTTPFPIKAARKLWVPSAEWGNLEDPLRYSGSDEEGKDA